MVPGRAWRPHAHYALQIPRSVRHPSALSSPVSNASSVAASAPQQTIFITSNMSPRRFSTAIGCSSFIATVTTKAAFSPYVKRPSCTAYRNSAARKLPSAVVQPDALSQIHRTIVNRFCDERRINRSSRLLFRRAAFSACNDQRAGDDIQRHRLHYRLIVHFASPISNARSSSLHADFSCSATESSLYITRQLTQQAEVFVRTGGNTNRHVGDRLLPATPLRELKRPDAGFQHLIARTVKAMGIAILLPRKVEVCCLRASMSST